MAVNPVVQARTAAPALPPEGPIGVEELEGRGAFSALGREWDSLLARGPSDEVHHRHAFLGAWLDAYGNEGRLRLLVARDGCGRLVGIAPLLERRRAGFSVLAAPANDHTPRVEWVLGEDAQGAVEAIWGHLRDRVRWDVLVLRDVRRDGPTSRLLEQFARRDRHPTGRWESLQSPYLALGAEPCERRLPSKFLGNLRRRRRRLAEMGAVSYRCIGPQGEPEAVDSFLEEFFALEAAGWKGRGGTAIARDARALVFYRRLAHAALREGWLALRALDLRGRAVAMQFGLAHRGVYCVPKLTYDERVGACSPGQLLLHQVLLECEGGGLSELDFLGPDMPWKRDWRPAFRLHDWLYVYRPGPVGTALCAAKHRLKPLTKEALSWLRR